MQTIIERPLKEVDYMTNQFDISIVKSGGAKVFEMTLDINVPSKLIMDDVYRFIDIIWLLEKDE